MRRWMKLAAGAVALALATAGCAGSGGSSGGGNQGGERELTVWLMQGSSPESLANELHKDFQDKHKARVKYEVQQWGSIQQKLTTALASNDAPDLIELGNTQTSQFAAQGVLADLSGSVSDFNGSQWLAGLKASGQYDGKTYGVPFYAANREVLYRKDLFEQAGITSPPASRAE